MLPDNFIGRLLITLISYSILYNLKSISLIFIIILLIFLDWLDIDTPFIKWKSLENYHVYDKINDIISYLLLLPLLYKLVSPDLFRILVITTLYRLYGVINNYINPNSDNFIRYFDSFKELLLVEYLSKNNKFINKYKMESIVITLLLKINFEYIHHKTNITANMTKRILKYL
jgi:hypothetical protein